MEKLLHYLFMGTRYLFYSLIIQGLLVTVLLAREGKSQVLSVNEVVVRQLDLNNVKLKDALIEIEKITSYNFVYTNKDFPKNTLVSISIKNESLGNILLQLSQQADIKFQQVNKNISVKSMGSSTEKNQKRIEIITQTRNVTGKVTSLDDGSGLPGVNVIEKGTNNGTVTDVEGDYSLSVTEGSTLIFSSVGYTSEEVQIGNKSVIDLAMAPDIKQLEELVVIGYGGEAKRSDLTGAVGSVQGSSISERKTTQVSQALQGAIPGVMVTRSNNAPGAGATIRIRGITTIGESNPLIIMDGMPVDNIDNINPNDIENISVLKDAASASIYGSRAAAGVILVTTKRAKAGQVSLDYNVEFGFEKPTALPEYVDVVRYMEMTNELRWNDNGNNANEYPLYAQDVVENYYDLNASNPNEYPITDWVGLVLKENAPRSRHTLSIAGGNEFIRSRASLNYENIEGLYMGRSYERFTARLNNDAKISDKITATADIFFKRSISKQPSMDPMYFTLISAPVYAAEWSDGRVAEGKTGANVYGQIKHGGFRDDSYNQIGGKVSLDYAPIDGLKLSAIVSPMLNFDKGKNFQKKVPYYDAEDPSVLVGTLQWGAATSLNESRIDYNQVTTQLLANYNKSFGAHSLNLMGGFESFKYFYESMGASRNQYELSSFPYLNLGPLEYRDNNGNAIENAYQSWFGRLMYNYKDKYYLQGNFRYDASSRFHKDYRWGFFPSLAVGWTISEESFMNIAAIPFLKVRASWGSLGNERIGNYPYQSTIGFSDALFFQGSNVVSAQTAAQWQYAIQDISWETTQSYNIGVDASFLNNRLSFTGDYYTKVTKDMLLPLEIPDYIGFDNPDQNTGKMNTKGWELQTSWNDKINDLNYFISFNLSDFVSEMGDLGGIQFLGDQIKIQGSEFNEWYGYLSDGIFQTQEEVDNSPKTSASVKPGDIKYVDVSGPEGVPDGIISGDYDRVLLGGSMPRLMYGGNVRLDYKGVDFSFVIQGVGKQNDRLEGLMVTPLMENWGHVPRILDGSYWSLYNTDDQNLSAKYPRLTRIGAGNNYAMSDFWMFNGSYLRLKNLTLGYTLPQSLVNRLNIKQIRAYGTVSDLFTLNKYPKGWDPEVSATGYPITSSFLLGLSVRF